MKRTALRESFQDIVIVIYHLFIGIWQPKAGLANTQSMLWKIWTTVIGRIRQMLRLILFRVADLQSFWILDIKRLPTEVSKCVGFNVPLDT